MFPQVYECNSTASVTMFVPFKITTQCPLAISGIPGMSAKETC
jgi:hypothetical protein